MTAAFEQYLHKWLHTKAILQKKRNQLKDECIETSDNILFS